MPIEDGFSNRIPTKLKEGEVANYYIPLNETTNWVENFSKNFLQPHPKIRLKFTKVQVFTSIGKKFEARIEKGLAKRILEKITQ